MADRWHGVQLSRFDPFRGLTNMHNDINRVFDSYFGPRPRAVADLGTTSGRLRNEG
jgi:hypothetical protein